MNEINLKINDWKMSIEVVGENKKGDFFVQDLYVIPFNEVKTICAKERKHEYTSYSNDIAEGAKEIMKMTPMTPISLVQIQLARKEVIAITDISREDAKDICEAFFNAKDLKRVVENV